MDFDSKIFEIKLACKSWHIFLEVADIEKCCQKQRDLESHFFSRLDLKEAF